MPRRDQHTQPESEFLEKVIQVSRVSKKTKGGNQIGFSTLVVVGDKKGRVGVAVGKAPDVLSSIKKGVRKAKKRFVRVPLKNGTIPFAIEHKHGAGRVYLKPAPKGSGIIAGGAVRAVVEAAGVTDVVGKILGSNNQINTVYATYDALREIRRLVKVKQITIKSSSDSESKAEVKQAAKPAVQKKDANASQPSKKASVKAASADTKKKQATKTTTNKKNAGTKATSTKG